jgi:hypothetical protein
MSNPDAAFGLRLIGTNQGSAFNARVRPYFIPSTYATALYVGDPVIKTGTSNTTEFDGNAIGSLPEINKATAGDGNAITGVIVGFKPNPDSLVTYHAASTAQVAYVCDDPCALFEIQADGTLAATSVGLNAVLIYTNSGSTYTGFSGAELDTTSDVPAADASNQLTILNLSRNPDNDVSSANSIAVVRINNHTEAHGVIGI